MLALGALLRARQANTGTGPQFALRRISKPSADGLQRSDTPEPITVRVDPLRTTA